MWYVTLRPNFNWLFFLWLWKYVFLIWNITLAVIILFVFSQPFWLHPFRLLFKCSVHEIPDEKRTFLPEELGKKKSETKFLCLTYKNKRTTHSHITEIKRQLIFFPLFTLSSISLLLLLLFFLFHLITYRLNDKKQYAIRHTHTDTRLFQKFADYLLIFCLVFNWNEEWGIFLKFPFLPQINLETTKIIYEHYKNEIKYCGTQILIHS